MDDDNDKSIVERTMQTVKEIASSVSNAAKHAMEPEPIREGAEVVMMPMTDPGMFGVPVTPQFVVLAGRKKPRKRPSKVAAKKAAKKIAKKATKRSSKKLKPKLATKRTVSKKGTKKKATRK